MALSQTLQPNQRGTALYKGSIFQGYEDVVTVSAEQLADETEVKDIETTTLTILAQDWRTFTKEQLAVILQKVVKRLIKKGLLP